MQSRDIPSGLRSRLRQMWTARPTWAASETRRSQCTCLDVIKCVPTASFSGIFLRLSFSCQQRLVSTQPQCWKRYFRQHKRRRSRRLQSDPGPSWQQAFWKVLWPF